MGLMSGLTSVNESIEMRGASGVVACWSCKGPVAARALFCATCGSVQPPHALDHFARLGLGPGFDISEDELSRRYFGLQARLHPDRFATKSARERAISMAQATALNQAYQTLRDPLARASYLLSLSGAASATRSSGTIDDPELLVESMERREELAAAESAEEVAGIAARAAADTSRCLADLSAAFKAQDLESASRLTLRLKYLTKLADEARAHGTRFRETS
jgi:molecular chaperone HscB